MFNFLFIFTLLTSILSAGCQKTDPNEPAQAYLNQWENMDYTKMYSYLSSESKEIISEEDFVKRYNTIFSAIKLKKIQIIPGEIVVEEDEAYLSFEVKFNTDTVGKFTLNYTIPLILEGKEWKINWTPSLIFPGMGPNDKVSLTTAHAKRGNIVDRYGNSLAIEGEAYTVGAVPGKIPNEEEFAKILAPILELEEDYILDQLHQNWVRDDTLVPLRNYPLSISQEFKNKILSVKGVMLVTNVVTDSRRYLHNELYSHVIGYVQRVNAEDLEEKEGYQSNDLIGRQGIEAAFEEFLHGQAGYTLTIKGEDNKEKKLIAQTFAKHGDNVSLTLDPKVQVSAYNALKGNKGSIIVLNPVTGEVLAMVSYPDYNPNIFPNGVPPSQWKELSQNPDKPFINRAIYALYPPGSTYKPFTAAIALEEGIITPDTIVPEARSREWTPSGNWNAPPIRRTSHPDQDVNLDRALVWSDNIYFAWVALQMEPNTFESYSSRFGIGESLPFDLPLYNSLLKKENTPWSPRLLATSSFGQGEMLVTPLHMATMYTAFVNQGDMVLPQLVKQVQSADGTVMQDFKRKIWKEKALSPEMVNTILPSLINVVEDPTGTGHKAYIDGLKIAGKTGTAQLDDQNKNEISWFIGFTLDTDNPLLVCITLEVPAGEGGHKLDMARNIFYQYYFEK